jgi:transcription factor IIIB subunit 2
MLVSRFLSGIGTGIMTSIVPVYQSELCEARNRGMYVCSQPLAVGVGISGAYWFDYGMSFAPGSIAWRLPVAFQVLFIIVVTILVVG